MGVCSGGGSGSRKSTSVCGDRVDSTLIKHWLRKVCVGVGGGGAGSLGTVMREVSTLRALNVTFRRNVLRFHGGNNPRTMIFVQIQTNF